MNPGLKTLGRPFSRLLIATAVAAAFPAHANDQADIDKLKAQIQELDQKLRILDRKQELASEDLTAKQKAAPVINASDKGFGFKSADGQFEYKLRGVVHADYRNFSGTAYPNAIDGFLARRIRPTFEGTVFGKYGFRFTPEFGESGDGKSNSAPEQNRVRVIDAYLDINHNPAAKIRIGKFKPFVGLERLQSASDIKFIERSYVSNNILPNRDFGISVFGDVLDNKLNYALGVFNGVSDGADNSTAQDLNSGKEFTARLFATPFTGTDSALKGLGFGVAGTAGNSVGTLNSAGDAVSVSNLPSYKTPGQANNFFSYKSSTRANGTRTRLAPQAYFYSGPFGLITEYAIVTQDINNVAGDKPLTVKNDALQIAASWLLTGEDASFKGVKPYSPFKPGAEGGWGAVELVARYQAASIDKDLFTVTNATLGDTNKDNAQRATTIGFGLNWYLNESSKVALNYDRTNFDGGYSTGGKRLDGKAEDVFIARYQLAF
jgi:phosphate-selective porin OprO/OprP